MSIKTIAPLKVRKPGNELRGFRRFGSTEHHLFGRIGTAIDDVVAHRAVEQRSILGHNADIGAERILGDMGDVVPIDQDMASARS